MKNIFQKIKNKKVFLFAFIFVLLIVLGSVYLFLPENKKNSFVEYFSPSIPSVIGGNFDLNYKKIPFNVKYIDFVFSEDLDNSTINKKNINISPDTKGNFSLFNDNTIRFNLETELEIGKNVLFSFSEKIKSKNGQSINKIDFDLNVISSAKAMRISPEGNLENLDQTFIVFFNIPIVPLTDLDSRDILPCPISFEPKIEGICKWTTTSILEFLPKNRLVGATDYKVKVENVEGLLYDLEETKEISLKTPNLNYYIRDNFGVDDGINLRFNFPVKLEELNEKLTLKDSLNKNLNIIITKKENSETNFNIQLKNNKFDYKTNYNLQIQKGLKSKYGNRAIKHLINKNLLTYNFLENIQAFRNIYSSTGTLINTKKYFINNENNYKNYNLIPVNDIFFHLSFDKEIDLNKKYFSFEDNKGNNIDYDINYITEEKYNKELKKDEEFINKKKIKFNINKSLENNKEYTLTISKDINSYLKNDIINKIYTSKEFLVKDFNFISYNKSCLYLNKQINDYWKQEKNIIETNPKTRISSVYYNEWIPYGLKKLDEEALVKKGYCRKAKAGEYLYVINTRLNPNTNYKLNVLNGFEDKYGNKIKNAKDFFKDVKTGDIAENDKYLYSSVSKDINVIPSNLPIVVNLQTINLDKVKLEVCEMDELGYIDYFNKRWKSNFVPKCKNKKIAELPVKNNYWNLTNNKFDLVSDILKNDFKTNYILVKGYKTNNDLSFDNIYIRSNLSLVFEKAENKSLLFVTDFDGNIIKDNLEMSFFTYNKKSKLIEKNDIKYNFNEQKGVFEFIDNKFDYAIIKNDKYSGFLNLNNDRFSNYDFKYISGETTSQKNYLYLYTPRPIYKPGDTVYFKGLLRKFEPTGYSVSDIKNAKLEVIDSSRKVIATQDIVVNENSNFTGEIIIPKEVSLGKFSFRFTNKEEKNNYTVKNNAYFYIEEYVKPTIKIDVLDNKDDYILGEQVKLTINPKYYFGGKLINTTGEYSVMTQNYFFDAKDYSSYQFGINSSYFDCIYWGYCNYDDSLNQSKEFSVNESGIYDFEYNFDKKDLKGEKIYNFNFDIKDPDTNKTVSKTVSKVLHNTDAYVGIKSKYYNSLKNGINLTGVVLDFDAKPLDLKNIKIELIKREYNSVKKKGVDGIFYNDYSLKETKENEYFVKSNEKGLFSKLIYPKTTGGYQIKAIYTGSNKKEFISSKTVYVAGNDYVEWHNDNNDVTELVAEKIQVKVGEKAEYMLKSPINTGKVLFVVEKDDSILDYFIHDLKSYSDLINLGVKDTYYPNYYLRAYLIGSSKTSPLPIYKRALSVTKVATDYKKLNIKIDTNKQNYKPGEKVNLKIKVTDSNGKAVKNANLSVSLVDESLLALKGNPKKNPYAFFYELKRYLGTTTYGSLKNLIEKLEIKDTSSGEKGGAGEKIKGGDSKKKRGTFKDTAFWQASSTTNENGFLEIQTSQLPDNLTTWVIEVLANTKVDNKIGVNYSSIKTNKTLMINDNLPSFLGSKDEIVLSPVIFNKTGVNKNFTIDLNLTNCEILGQKSKKIYIKDGESKNIDFIVKVNDIGISENKDLFNSKINFKVESDDKKDYDEIEKFIQIKETSTNESVSTFGKTKTSSFEEKIEVGNIKNSVGKLTINYSATLLNSLIDSISYLSGYPYGSSRSKTSAIMPNIFIKKLYNSMGDEYDLSKKMVKYWVSEYVGYKEKSVDQIIKEYLVDIKKYQKRDGGFVYYHDLSEKIYPNFSNFELSSYILESAGNIRDIGYKIDETIYFDIVSYLKNRFYKNQIEGCSGTYNNCTYSNISRLKAISAILSFDNSDYEAYKMWKLIDLKKTYYSFDLENVKVIAKILKLKELTKQEKIDLEQKAFDIVNKIISEKLVFNPKGAFLESDYNYSRFQNTVLLIDAISSIGLNKFSDIGSVIDNMNRWVILQRKNGNFGSINNNISVIKAFTSYLENSGELKNINYFTKLKLNSEIIEEKNFTNKNKFEVYTKFLKLDDLKKSNSFIVEKAGNGSVYYDLNLSYYKDTKDIKARDEGFYIEKQYYLYDDYKKIKSIKQIEWKKYRKGEISYDDLIYPKETIEYLIPVKTGKKGDLLIVRNKIIIKESRDNIIFEGFIPSGSQLVNPNLDTSSKKVNDFSNSYYFNKQEFRFDRYFAYTKHMREGVYNLDYLIKLTHSGEFLIRPSKAFEMFDTAVFGRSKGEVFVIEN